MRVSVGEVVGSVERIHEPGNPLTGSAASFFSVYGVHRVALADSVDYQGLGFVVGFGHEVVRMAFVLLTVRVCICGPDHRSRSARQPDGELQHFPGVVSINERVSSSRV